jgi:hypothetical protein
MKIVRAEIERYGAFLPYFNELRRTLPGSGFGGLSPADRYVPTYLYMLLQMYAEEGGNVEALDKQLADKGINLNDLEAYLPNR